MRSQPEQLGSRSEPTSAAQALQLPVPEGHHPARRRDPAGLGPKPAAAEPATRPAASARPRRRQLLALGQRLTERTHDRVDQVGDHRLDRRRHQLARRRPGELDRGLLQRVEADDPIKFDLHAPYRFRSWHEAPSGLTRLVGASCLPQRNYTDVIRSPRYRKFRHPVSGVMTLCRNVQSAGVTGWRGGRRGRPCGRPRRSRR